MLGFVSTIFIDDTLLMGDSEKKCVQNVKSSLALFKSLGFEIDSQSMTVGTERKQRLLSTASKLLTGRSSTVRELAQFIGQVVSCFQGVTFGPLWYRYTL